MGDCLEPQVISFLDAHNPAASLWSILTEDIHSQPPRGKYLESGHREGKAEWLIKPFVITCVRAWSWLCGWELQGALTPKDPG